jgi:hypothetical protein
MEDKFKKLVLDHADAMAEHRRLKLAGSVELTKCTRARAVANGDGWGPNCIEAAYEEVPKLNHECGPGDGYSFEEVFRNMEPEPCEHCVAVRRLKKERAAVGRRIGAIRAAMAVAAKAERTAAA